jgi:signal transduction histidine kinase
MAVAGHEITDAEPRHHGFVRWVGEGVDAFMRVSPVAAAVCVAGLIAIGWMAIYLAGGTRYVPSHWFYVPILLAAIRFRIKGAVMTALVASVAAGLLPTDVAQGVQAPLSAELYRAIYFVLMGVLIAAIILRLEESLQKETRLAKQEADLAAQQAALVSTVSHEFRSPLSVLIATSRMLQEGGDSGIDPTFVDGIASASRRLNDLVTAILAMSEGPHIADHDLTDVRLREVFRGVRESLDYDVRRRVKIDFTDEVVRTNPVLLEAALGQLVDNALKFSPGSSPVEIDAWTEPEGRVSVVVSDRGPGVDEAFVPRAFDAFTQADDSMTRPHGGLGIGLYVAQRLTQRLDAELELRPRAGGGTQAVVLLPVEPRSTKVPEVAPQPLTSAPARP